MTMPQSSDPLRPVIGRSIATTIRSDGGAASICSADNFEKDQSEPATSVSSSPSISWRPNRAPAQRTSISSRKSSAKFARFAVVRAWILTVLERFNNARNAGLLRGVVVIQACGLSPKRKQNWIISQASSALRHLANSSTHTASNCGPRNESGSCAENICAVAPFGHSNIRRPAIHFGRCSGGDTARMPLSPNTMISRACSYVSAISPIRRLAPAADGLDPQQCHEPIQHPHGFSPHHAPQDHPTAPIIRRWNLVRYRPKIKKIRQCSQSLVIQDLQKCLLT
jgi:hypothetical protein